ncbi:MAG TPA: ABC transporter ATP-binding protein [Nitrososphaerales archaeon]|nr:ABC transporter ATP-binding protein [Nitrososphaerales archaeon]
MIKVEGLTKVFSKKAGPAIDSVTFDVNNGEIVGFVGLNGAGKTTTIRAAAGVSTPTAGHASIDGFDLVTQKVEASRRLGWVPEVSNFEPNAKALSLMEYFAGYYGIPGPEATAKSVALMKSVGLEGNEGKKLRAYSQGMKKRFALAAAMLASPKNYLFDEVLNGLDPEGIRYFRRLMIELKAEGAAVLLSSHILVEVESIADRIVFIHRGKIIKIISRADLATVGGMVARIVIQRRDQKLMDFLKGFGEPRLEGEVILLSATGDLSHLNSELVKMGYEVSEFSTQKEGLEDYFMKLIGES